MVVEKSQGLAECLGEIDIMDIVQDKVEDAIDQKLEEKGDKKVIEQMKKEAKKGKAKEMAGSKGELFPKHMRKPFIISMVITTLAYSMVMGGGILDFVLWDFVIAIPIVLFSVALVNLGLEASSLFFNRLQHVLSQWRIWAMGLVILFVSSLFGSPFGNPGKSYDPVKEKFKDKSLKKKWKKIKKRREARTETGRTLTGIAFLFPFGLCFLIGNEYFDVLANSGIFIALVGVTYCLLPVGKNPGKRIFKWKKEVYFPLAVLTLFLFVAFTLSLIPNWTFFVFGFLGCLLLAGFFMYTKTQVEKEKKKLKSKECAAEISKIKEGDAMKVAEEVEEFEKKLAKARAKVEHYTEAGNDEKVEKWTARVGKYERHIAKLKARYAELMEGVGSDVTIADQSATTQLEVSGTMSGGTEVLDVSVKVHDTPKESEEKEEDEDEVQEPGDKLDEEEKDEAAETKAAPEPAPEPEPEPATPNPKRSPQELLEVLNNGVKELDGLDLKYTLKDRAELIQKHFNDDEKLMLMAASDWGRIFEMEKGEDDCELNLMNKLWIENRLKRWDDAIDTAMMLLDLDDERFYATDELFEGLPDEKALVYLDRSLTDGRYGYAREYSHENVISILKKLGRADEIRPKLEGYLKLAREQEDEFWEKMLTESLEKLE